MPAQWVETRLVPLSDLARYPGNARRGDVEQIRASIRAHGQYRSLIVRDDNGQLTVLAGNHTADALEAEGAGRARCEVITCTEAEARKINIADNRLGEYGSWDDGALADLLRDLDGDWTGTGWSADDYDDLLSGLKRVPELPPGGPTGARWAEPEDQLAQRTERVASYEPRTPVGTGEVILVYTLDLRDEFAALIRQIRARDGQDLTASQITLEAMRAYAPAVAAA